MTAADAQPTPVFWSRCAHCGAVIGVYEPAVHVLGSTPRRTSRAAEPSLPSSPGLIYHAACHELCGRRVAAT